MQPIVALSITLTYILISFIIDFKDRKSKSSCLWIPTLWIILSVSRPLYYWFNPDFTAYSDTDFLEGNLVDRLVLIILIIAAIIVLTRRKVLWRILFKKNNAVFILYLLMAISIIWSSYMHVSLKRFIKSLGNLMIALVLVTDDSPEDAVIATLKKSAYLLLPLSFLFIKYYREIGVRYNEFGTQMWVGVTTHKNLLGIASAIYAITFLWILLREKKIVIFVLYISYLLLSFWLLIGLQSSYSAASIFILSLGILLVLLFHYIRFRPYNFIKLSIIFVVFIFFLFFFANRMSIQLITDTLGRDATFTGRTYIWSQVINIALQKPILGMGYGSFWIGDLTHHLWDLFRVKIIQAHNGYVDVFLQLGILGIVLLLYIIYKGFKNILESFSTDYHFSYFRFSVVLIIIIHNIVESSFIRGTHFGWVIFLILILQKPLESIKGKSSFPS